MHVRNKVFTLTCHFQPWVKSLVHLQVRIQLIFLTEIQNSQDFFNNLWEVMQRQLWLQILVHPNTTMNKPSVHYVMHLKPKESKTNQKLMRIQKMPWFDSIRSKYKDWKNSFKESCHQTLWSLKKESRFPQRDKSNWRTGSMMRRKKWQMNWMKSRPEPSSSRTRLKKSMKKSN